ncbi:MAG: sensor histidine kinase [Halodesulfurarchaeum sp.]
MDSLVSQSSTLLRARTVVSNYGVALSRWELTPGRIAAVYLLFGFVGLYISDVIFASVFAEPLRSQVQAIKGAIEVLLTAGFVYALSLVSRRQLERTNRELERRNEELHVLHRVLRHNLRNDLNVIEGHAQYVLDSLTDENIAETCETILAKTHGIVSYIERAGQIRRLNERDGSEIYDLGTTLPAVIERSEAIPEAANLEIEIPDETRIRANHMFPAAFEELLTNAVTHAQNGPSGVSITVSANDAPDGMTAIDVTDDGPGIPADVQRIIESDERDQLAHLSGLGLWFVHWTLTDAGGTLSFSADGDGTTVRMLAPTAEST